jgi:IS30 family transposase
MPWDRVIIAKYYQQGCSISAIARSTGFHKATISRELRRNGTMFGYEALRAQERRNGRSKAAMQRRPRAIGPLTDEWICEKLRARWSPEQIAGRSESEAPQKVSHEYVYRFVGRERRAGGKLYEFLRRRGRRRYKFKSASSRSKIPNRVDISTRPKVVDERRRLGDLEGDLIVGRDQLSHLVVAVDRVSRLVGLEKARTKSKKEVNRCLKRILKRNAQAKTLTVDNGLEFGLHEKLTSMTGVKVYFASAYSAWQRGTVENTNGLLRQYFPRKTDFRLVSESQIKQVEKEMNERPRKCLGYRTPKERHFRPKR